MLVIFSFQTTTVQIVKQTTIQNCYSEQSSVVFKEDSKQICLYLVTNNNSECYKIPRGINVTIKLDKLGMFQPIGYFNDFNYSATKEICVSCSNILCNTNKFYESTSVSATIRSYGYRTSISVGIVIREQQNLNLCIQHSFIKVFKTQLQIVAEINDQCWQLFQNNNYLLINSTIDVQFLESNKQLTYTPGSPIVLTEENQKFIFTLYNPQSYNIFDQNNFELVKFKIYIKQSNTYNIIQSQSNVIQIDSLPPGFSQLRLRVNQKIFQLSGIPSEIGKLYQQQAAQQQFDAFNIQLKIQFQNKVIFFHSIDSQTYINGQIQTFICQSTQCSQDMIFVIQNINKIQKINTITSVFRNNIILYMIAETVTSIYQGCYDGFHLNYDQKYTEIHLMLNEQSNTCPITAYNKNYQYVLNMFMVVLLEELEVKKIIYLVLTQQ
ncbi:Conserved_hypothetical protein [Hexamita inflata]|uniref:Transmembrane protein n=1 Tax=Hexamita inflata TaxID=28002 RepID=A0ABP1HLJ9_9EUKA